MRKLSAWADKACPPYGTVFFSMALRHFFAPKTTRQWPGSSLPNTLGPFGRKTMTPNCDVCPEGGRSAAQLAKQSILIIDDHPLCRKGLM
jgi:hypothetical protein